MKEYLGHSKNKYGIEEPLIDHLLEVAKLAEEFTSRWRNGLEGYATGMVHDLGKYSVLFQYVLRGKESNVDHATPGALAALKLNGVMGFAGGIAVEGHHGGLLSGAANELQNVDLKEGFSKRGKKYSVFNYDQIIDLFKKDGGVVTTGINSDYPSLYKQKEYAAAMLYVRMLFSALVDADYLATEAHFKRTSDKYLYRDRGEQLSAEYVVEKLLQYVEKIRMESKADLKVKKMRDEIFSYCLKAGEREQGIYTLTAPTGTGKTLAMLAFAAVHAEKYKLDRIIFVLPYLNIIEQTASEYETILNGLAQKPYVLQDHSLVETTEGDFSKLMAENWDAPVIVTTTVKFFEGLFSNRSTVCRRLHNLTRAVVLFDEAQTMPRDLVLPTLATLSYLNKKYNTTVVFSTATQPAYDDISEKISKYAACGWKPEEIVPSELELFEKSKRVRVTWPEDLHSGMPWNEIATALINEAQVCSIVNLKKHAKTLFSILNNYDPDSTFHISTNMCPAHRLSVLASVKQRLSAQKPCRLVSTQCIEAGVNLDFPVLYRAMAPLEAIIQAAGRCNRDGRAKFGRCIVFNPLLDGKMYPTSEYEHASNIVKRLLLEKGQLDIYSPDIIREYYKLLFEDIHVPDRLKESLEILDFEGVARNYRWIDNNNANLLVPYDDEKELFNKLAQEARENGINKAWERQARIISVGAWVKKGGQLYDIVEPVFFANSMAYKRKEESGWYILLDDKAYSKKIGLDPESGNIETIA